MKVTDKIREKKIINILEPKSKTDWNLKKTLIYKSKGSTNYKKYPDPFIVKTIKIQKQRKEILKRAREKWLVLSYSVKYDNQIQLLKLQFRHDLLKVLSDIS